MGLLDRIKSSLKRDEETTANKSVRTPTADRNSPLTRRIQSVQELGPLSKMKISNTSTWDLNAREAAKPKQEKEYRVRNVFGTDEQYSTTNSFIPALIADIIARTVEIIPRAVVTGYQNLRSIVSGAQSINQVRKGEVPTSLEQPLVNKQLERLGFEGGKVISTGERANKAYEDIIASGEQAPEWLQKIAPSFKDQVGWAAYKAVLTSVVPDAFDTLFAGDIASYQIRNIVNKTAPPIAQVQAWETLGRPKNLKEARNSYFNLQKQFHPDRPGGSSAISSRVSRAYETLQQMGVPSDVKKIINNVARIFDTDLRDLASGRLRQVGSAIEPLPLQQLPGEVNAPLNPQRGAIGEPKKIGVGKPGDQPAPIAGAGKVPEVAKTGDLFAQGAAGGVANGLEGLAAEARKYKSAEEFVKAENQKKPTFGLFDTAAQLNGESNVIIKPHLEPFIYEAQKAKSFAQFARGVYEIPVKDLIGNTSPFLISPGISRTPFEPVIVSPPTQGGGLKFVVEDGVHRLRDAVAKGEKTIKVKFNPSTYTGNSFWARLQDFYDEAVGKRVAFNESQLTDLWNKANKGAGKNYVPFEDVTGGKSTKAYDAYYKANRIHDAKPKEEKPIKIETARDAAKDLIRYSVIRGDTLKQIQAGFEGSAGDEYAARVMSGGKIEVYRLNGKDLVPPERFSLKEIFNEIKGGKPEPKTQAKRVIETVGEKPKSIREVSRETGILEPNVRRILGVGAKDGTFERVGKGVYVLKTADGTERAYIEIGDAKEVLERMAKEGERKFESVILDPAYFSRALIGGNRGIKAWDFIQPEDFSSVMDSISKLVKDDKTHVYLMLSGARTAQVDMGKYVKGATDAGFKVVGEGGYKKLNKDGSPVTNVRGEEAAAERLMLMTLSGEARAGEIPVELNFRFVRPSIAKSYATEKPAELMKALIEQSTLKGETVLDPFAGSGVTGAEALKSGRNAVLIEKKPETVEKFTKPRVEKAATVHPNEGLVMTTKDRNYFEKLLKKEGIEDPTAKQIRDRFEEAANTRYEIIEPKYEVTERGKEIIAENNAIQEKLKSKQVEPVDVSVDEMQEYLDALDESLVFPDQEMETQYHNFVKLIKENRTPKFQEIIDGLDEDGLKTYLKTRGVDPVKVDRLFYSQEQTNDDVFQAFKERLEKTNPTLLHGTKTTEGLGMKETGAEARAQIAAYKRTQKIAAKVSKEQMRSLVAQQKEAMKAIKREPIGPAREKITMSENVLLRQRIQALSRGARQGALASREAIFNAQRELTDIVSQSGLDAADKAKFLEVIKNIQSDDQLNKSLPVIEERINRLGLLSQSRKLKTQILEKLSSTPAKRVNGKLVGNMTPEIQDLVDRLRKASKMSAGQAMDAVFSNLAQYRDGVVPFEVALENEVLQMMAGLESKNPVQLKKTLETIVELIDEGRMINELKKFNLQEKRDQAIDYVVDRITGGRGIKPARETTGALRKKGFEKIRGIFKTFGKNWFLDWEGLMETLDFASKAGNENLAKLFSVHAQENAYKEMTLKYTDDFKKMIIDSYGLKSESQVLKKVGELGKEEVIGTFKNADGVQVELKMSRDEMIKRYMELQDQNLHASFIEGNKYTPEIIDAITKKLSPEDIALARKQLSLYQEQYKKINEIYRDMTGVNLPSNAYYSPIRREGYVSDPLNGFNEFLEEVGIKNGVSPSSLKTRVQNTHAIAKEGSLSVLDRHITETNYYIAWAQKVRELTAIFKNPQVREAIIQEFNPALLERINSDIQHFITKGNQNAHNYKALDKLRKNFTIGALAVKPVIAFKQAITIIAYLEKLGPLQLTAGMLDFWLNPIKNYRTLVDESVFLRARATNIERDIKLAMETDVYKGYKARQSFLNTLMLNVTMGDRAAVFPGAWAMRRAAIKAGKSMSEVISEYEMFSNSTQQSSDLSKQSMVQKGGSFERMATMFGSGPRQSIQKELLAFRSLFKKGGLSPRNITKAARIFTIYHVLIPVAIAFIANFGRTDEEARKDYTRAAILGPTNSIFLIGQTLDNLVRALQGLQVFGSGNTLVTSIDKLVADLVREIAKLDLNDVSNDDIYEVMKSSANLSTYLTGIPLKQGIQGGRGVIELLKGNIERGVGNMLGWSDYSISGMSTSDSSKKKTPPYRQ